MPSVLREVGETFEALVKGFSVTFRNIFRKTVTENYPHEPVHFQHLESELIIMADGYL